MDAPTSIAKAWAGSLFALSITVVLCIAVGITIFLLRDPRMSLRMLRVDWRLRTLDSNGDLHMSNKSLTSSDVLFIAEGIRRNLPIRRLYLARNQLDVPSATCLSEVLKGNRMLLHLDVGNKTSGRTAASRLWLV